MSTHQKAEWDRKMRISTPIFGFLAWVALAAAGAPAWAQDALDGRYFGIKEGEGARIEIAPDSDGFRGKFFDAAGRSQSFEADRNGVLAEAVLDMGGETVLMRVDPKPYGADVALIPVDARGELIFASARFLTFLREGLSLPEPPPDYVGPPIDARNRIAANSFLASYEFWPPEGVRDGYLSLPPRFRTLMSLFPAVQLDVIFKLCLADNGGPALSQALRGQGVACAEVVEGMAAMQRNGSFNGFKQEVAAENKTLRLAVRCADGYVVSKAECDQASASVSKQAVSLQTAATVMSRYR